MDDIRDYLLKMAEKADGVGYAPLRFAPLGPVELREAVAEIDRLTAENDQLRMEVAGGDKARAILLAGMKSQAEICDGLKQDVRRLRAALAPFARLADGFPAGRTDGIRAFLVWLQFGPEPGCSVPAPVAVEDFLRAATVLREGE